jgi:2-enoate reductase
MKGDAMKYEHLFSPMKIGGIEVKNRIAMMPMGVFSPRLMGPDSAYSKDGADYYIARAKGGTGLIITGVCSIVDTPQMYVLRDHDSWVRHTQYLADGCHKYGAKVFIQFTALTGRASHGDEDFLPAPAPIQNVWRPDHTNRGMTVEEIHQYVANFAQAAANAQEAGCDGVEVHAVHEGYLLDQFVIANFNRRTDEYGGSLENRLRFPVEIVQAIKAKCGKDFPVSLRYSVKSYIKGFNRGALPGESFTEFGRDLPESRIIAKKLTEAGYDMLNCDNGTYDSWFWPHPPMYMPKACNLADVAEIKKVVDVPVCCAGRFDDPDLAESAISDGRIDMMGMGRPLLAEPEFVNKLAAGNREDIRPCISCHNGCLGRIFQGLDISCAVNPACGRELSYALQPAEKQKKILVIGGGLAGMEAARVCALRGHDVTLCEKAGELGGVFIASSRPDFKDDDKRLLAWYKKQMGDTGVKVRLDTPVTKEMTAEYDEVFCATGASERRLNIPGLNDGNTSYAVDALLRKEIPGQRSVVIGGGLTGCEIAYNLAKAGRAVTIVEMTETIINAFGLSAANYNMLMELIDYYKIAVFKNSVVDKYENGEVVITETVKNYPNIANRAQHMFALGAAGMPVQHRIPADYVIISVGYTSNTALYDTIKADNVHLIGDAVQPGNVESAVWQAYEAAMKV